MIKDRIVKTLVTLIIILFLFVYFMSSSGLYEYKMEKKKNMTEESIKRFEEDVKSGIKIDINDYIIKEKNYDNSFTSINKKISNYVSKGFERIIKYLARYMNNL